MNVFSQRLAKEFSDKEYADIYIEQWDNAIIAAQIKALREQRGWTQAQLAEKAGMKQERISALEDIEYDAWTVKTLRKLAKAFDVAVNVSFIPFSQRILNAANMTAASLRVESREKDLEHFLSTSSDQAIIDIRPTATPVFIFAVNTKSVGSSGISAFGNQLVSSPNSYISNSKF